MRTVRMTHRRRAVLVGLFPIQIVQTPEQIVGNAERVGDLYQAADIGTARPVAGFRRLDRSSEHLG